MILKPLLSGLLLFAAALGTANAATYTTVDVTGVPNSNVAINPQTFPTGTTNGNQGTGVPIDIATYNNLEGTWNAQYSNSETLTVPLTALNISGQASFYALLNNYYGTPGADEYDITISATNGDTVTYQSIGGVDTRDYNNNFFTNTIAATTTPWFDNGIGQRFDIREFTLPTAFAGDTISSFGITQVNSNDPALFSGLTFSDSSAKNFVPEPASWVLMIVGFGLTGAAVRRRGVSQTV